MKTIDLRSDTVTQPTHRMREAMREAELGDDVFAEDPTINRLEAIAADMLGTEAALFAASGTQSNLLAMLSHCQRGDEYIVGQLAHTYKYEAGGAAVLGSIQPQPLDFEDDGTLDLGKVRAFIKEDDFHFARTRLLCLENTQSGKVLPLSYLEKARELCNEKNLNLHLDGARVFNAAIFLQVPVKEIAQHFDSISFCLSKGLGAPVGSVLCGPREFVDTARRWRKMVGGGMRQAGMLAAAGIYALENHIERLSEDHELADKLANGLKGIDDIDVLFGGAKTNMVFIRLAPEKVENLTAYLLEQNIVVTPGDVMRLVIHLDIDDGDIERFLSVLVAFFASDNSQDASSVTQYAATPY